MRKLLKITGYILSAGWLLTVLVFCVLFFIATIKSSDYFTAAGLALVFGAILSCPVWFVWAFPWIMKKISSDQTNQKTLNKQIEENITEARNNLTTEDFLFNIRGPYLNFLFFKKMWKFEFLLFVLVSAGIFLALVVSLVLRSFGF